MLANACINKKKMFVKEMTVTSYWLFMTLLHLPGFVNFFLSLLRENIEKISYFPVEVLKKIKILKIWG